VKDVMLIEAVDVLAGNDVDAGVPVAVQGLHSPEKVHLFSGHAGKLRAHYIAEFFKLHNNG
jgi:hypothetical protein